MRKAQAPNERLCRGTKSKWLADECVDLAGLWYCKSSVRYGGWPVLRSLWTKQASLNRIRRSMGSQWSCLRSRHGVTEWQTVVSVSLISRLSAQLPVMQDSCSLTHSVSHARPRGPPLTLSLIGNYHSHRQTLCLRCRKRDWRMIIWLWSVCITLQLILGGNSKHRTARLPYNLYCVGGDVKHCTIYYQSDSAHPFKCLPGNHVWIAAIDPLWIRYSISSGGHKSSALSIFLLA